MTKRMLVCGVEPGWANRGAWEKVFIRRQRINRKIWFEHAKWSLDWYTCVTHVVFSWTCHDPDHNLLIYGSSCNQQKVPQPFINNYRVLQLVIKWSGDWFLWINYLIHSNVLFRKRNQMNWSYFLLCDRRLPRQCSLSFWVVSLLPSTPSTLLSGARDTSWLWASASSSPPAFYCCSLPSLACTTWACRSALLCSASYIRR